MDDPAQHEVCECEVDYGLGDVETLLVVAHEGGGSPSGLLWVHEFKHDGYRLMVRRDGSRDHCFTVSGHDWAEHFLAIVSKPIIADDHQLDIVP
jgi:hypothetical protein